MAAAARPGGTLRRLLPGLLLLLAAGPTAGDDAQDKAAELQRLRHSIESLQAELQRNREKKSRAEKQLRAIELRVSDTRRALQESRLALAEVDRQLAGLNDRRARTADSLKRQSGELAREVRAAYSMGGQQQIKLLLNQQEPAAVGRMLTYYSYFTRARRDTIVAMQQSLQELETLGADIEKQNERLLELREQQQQQTARLQKEQQQRRKVVARLGRKVRDQDSELDRLRRNEEQLRALVASLQKLLPDIPAEYGDQQPFGKLKGRLNWPARGRLATRFGSVRGDSGLKWQGVTIEAPEGGQVRAVSQGRVAFADWLRGFGLLLIVDHGDGYMTLYGHNQALYKEVGEWVDSGEVVATLGASGGQAQAGLYFEIRHNGQPVNPLGWCAGEPAAAAG